MAGIAYVNGQYVPLSHAMVAMEDRGYHFADGIYEVMAFYRRTLLDEMPHLARLERSLAALDIAMPMPLAALRLVMRELIRRNPREQGTLYLQITRGVAKRDHPFPKTAKPSLTLAVYPLKTPKAQEVTQGVRVITLADQRWVRRDIKSISLLPNILARQQSAAAGAREAWLFEKDGTVTEGSASNSYIVTPQGELLTHPATHAILGGITREAVLNLARAQGIKFSERSFNVEEAKAAREAFLTSTSANVLPVTRIDDAVVGDGVPGEITLRLLAAYRDHITQQTGFNAW